MYFIGDVHGKIPQYLSIVKGLKEPSLQLGDMGIGFTIPKIPTMADHKFFRGNHDSPNDCRRHPNYVGDYGMYNGVFVVSGADSIDKDMRIPGVSWWSDEELSYADSNHVLDLYEKEKPSAVASHDCPQSIAEAWFGIHDCSFTRNLLQALLEIHRPKVWVFAHHHRDRKEMVDSTLFVALNELSSFRLEDANGGEGR